MTFEEKVAMANTMRSRSRVGPVSPEELAVLPGTEKELWIEVADGRKVHLFEAVSYTHLTLPTTERV